MTTNPIAGAMMTDDDILRLVAEKLGNPLLFEDLKEDFTVHTEAEDWIKFARALLSASETSAVDQQESGTHIASVYEDKDGTKYVQFDVEDAEDIPVGTKLYPVARTLTRREIEEIAGYVEGECKACSGMTTLYIAAEAAVEETLRRITAPQPVQTAVVLDDGRAAFVNGLSRTQCNAIEYFVTQMRGVDSAAYVDMFDAFRDYINSLVGPVQARAASPQLVAQTAESTDSEFKNFHRLLCERFDYTHDDKDWKRDQLSLIEWIAAAPQPELTERAITDEQISLLAAEYSSVLRGSKIGDWDFAFSDYRELTKFARALLAAAQPATEDKP